MSAHPKHSPHSWVLSDGHAGNVRQAMALAQALALPIAREWTLQPGRMARWFAPRRWPGAKAAFGSGFEQALAAPPAIAIGCGRQAALATRLLRTHGARAVQLLDPRIDPRHWDVVVAPEHDGLAGAHVVTVLGSLNPVDDAWLAQARADFPGIGALPGPRVAVLIGGPTRHSPLQAEAVLTMVRGLAHAIDKVGGTLLLSASRRTPDAWVAPLRAALSDRPAKVWFGPADGPNPYPGLLGWADAIACTPDSVNMLSEACATRAPVFAIEPECVQGRPRRFIDALRERGRLRTLLEPQELLQPSARAEPLRETARAAGEVARRLGLAG